MILLVCMSVTVGKVDTKIAPKAPKLIIGLSAFNIYFEIVN